MAEKAYGPDIGSIKGKTTRPRPKIAVDNMIEIPRELISIHERVILSLDGMTINMLKFLTTIAHEIMYKTCQYLIKARAEDYEKLLNEIYYVYRKGGFVIEEIHCDNEFHKSMDKFAMSKSPVIKVNYSNA